MTSMGHEDRGQPNPPPDDAPTMPLGIMTRPEGMPDASELDMEPPRPTFKSLNRGTLLFVGLAVVAVVAIYAMRLSRGQIATALTDTQLEARIEQALAKLTKPQGLSDDDPLLKKNLKELFSDTDAIVRMFANDAVQHQVPIEFVKKNPFDLGVAAATDGAGLQRQQQDMARKLSAELGRMKLQSVVNGRVPLAMINDQMCQVGDRVGSFQVLTIRQRDLAVDLTAGGATFTLTMESSPTVKGVNAGLLRNP